MNSLYKKIILIVLAVSTYFVWQHNYDIQYSKAQTKIIEENIKQGKLNEGKFLNKCFKDWTGETRTFKSSKYGLNFCTYVNTCDYQFKDKCVTSLVCNQWVRYDYINEIVILNKLKPTKCPKGKAHK